MIVLGIVLIIVGAALAYFVGEQIARFAAVVLVLLGLLLVVLGVLDTADTHSHLASIR